MANTVIQLKKSGTPSATPATLANGELAINYADGKLFYKDTLGNIQEISGGGGGPFFGSINVAGTLVVPDIPGDILTINSGNNIELTPDTINDSYTITANLKPAFDVANAAFGHSNTTYAAVNSAFVVINAAFDTANNIAPQVAPSYNVANAAFDKANAALPNTTGAVFNGNLNIKTDLWIGNNITNVSSIIFNTSTNRTPTSHGELTWSQDDSTLHFNMDTPGNVIGHIGQDLFYLVKNQSGSTIAKGTVVRFAGTLGASGRLLVEPAIANNSYPSKYIMGVTAEAITNGSDGYVVAQGKIRGIDMSMFSAGDILYVSPSTPGAFSNTMPTAPNNKITIAAVINNDNNQGSIEVRVTLGSKLNEDELVELNGLANGQVITYVSANGRFENSNVLVSAYNTLNAAYAVANAAFAAQNADYTMSNAGYNLANTVYAAVNSAFSVINAAYTQSNTDNVRLSSAYVSLNAGYTVANAGFTVANAAFAKANNALANTSGVYFNGNLFFPSGNVGIGSTTSNAKLFIQSSSSIAGIRAYSDQATAILGQSIDAVGVTAFSETFNAIEATSNGSSYGIIGSSRSGVGVYARSISGSPLVVGKTAGSDYLTVNNAGNVGIGTSAPSSTLHVIGTANITSSVTANDYNSSTTGYKISGTQVLYYSGGVTYLNDLGGGIGLRTASTTRLFIDTSGNVGINTSSPKALLDVKPLSTSNTFSMVISSGQTVNGFGSLRYTTSYAHNDLLLGNFQDAAGYSQTAISFGYTGDPARKLHIGSANSSTFDSNASFVPAVTVTSGGRLGVGTTSPATTLHVIGTANVSSTIYTRDIEAPFYSLYNEGAGAYVGIKGNYLRFGGVSEFMRIANTSGYVGIGTTAPQTRLHVKGSVNGDEDLLILEGAQTGTGVTGLLFKNSGGPAHSGAIRCGPTVQDPSGGRSLTFWGDVSGTLTERMRLDANGNFGLGVTSPKDNTKPVRFALSLTSNTVSSGIFIADNFAFAAKSTGGSHFSSAIASSTNFPGWSNYFAQTERYQSGNIADGSGFNYYSLSNPRTAGISQIGTYYSTIRSVQTSVSSIYGFVNLTYLQNTAASTGIITNAYGFHSKIQSAVGPTLTGSQYDFYADTYDNSDSNPSSIITNRYGVYLAYSNAYTTNAWGIYQVDANVKNYFAGSVGIGTNTPSYKLDVSAAVANGVRFDGARPITFNSNGLGEIRIKASSGGWSTGYLFSGSAGTDIGGFGAYGGSDSLTYHWVGSAYNTPTAVFTSGGNVGIGTISPSYKLDVVGDVRANSFISGNSSIFTNTVITAAATDQIVDSFTTSTWRSAQYNITMTAGTDYHTTQISLIHDGTNAYITEYGTLSTANNLGTFSATVSGSTVRLNVVPTFANTSINMLRTTNK